MARSTEGAPLDPSSGEGRRLLADELSKAEYGTQDSLLRRAVDALREWVTNLFDGASGGTLNVWEYVLVGLAALAAAAALALVLWSVLRLEPARRHRRAASGGVFDEPGVRADDYRRRAQAARSAGNHRGAVLDGYRALVAESVERFVLDDLPGATAREIAAALAPVFPPEAERLAGAAAAFDAVRYGDESASAADADAVLQLEARLRVATPSAEVTA